MTSGPKQKLALITWVDTIGAFIKSIDKNQIATAVKRARELALLPYVGEGSGPEEREGGGRGGRGGRDR